MDCGWCKAYELIRSVPLKIGNKLLSFFCCLLREIDFESATVVFHSEVFDWLQVALCNIRRATKEMVEIPFCLYKEKSCQLALIDSNNVLAFRSKGTGCGGYREYRW